jgi:lysophospholipase L1-like esterase
MENLGKAQRLRFGWALAALFFAVMLQGGHLIAAEHKHVPTDTKAKPQPDPTVPAPRDAKWMVRHEGFVAEAKKGGIDLLFLGDSITDNWRGAGKDIWKACYAPLHAANFGIGGDRTENVLWRLNNGEVAGIKPKVVVLMIGINNHEDSAANMARGVGAVVNDLRARLPDSKILLLAIFPRDEKANTPNRKKIAEVNKELSAALESQGENKMVTFMDIGSTFLAHDGSISKDVMGDYLHPTAKGYYLWAQAMDAELESLVGEKIPAPPAPESKKPKAVAAAPKQT